MTEYTSSAQHAFEMSASVPLADLIPASIELLPIAAYTCDRFGRILSFNRRAADLWGRTPVVGESFLVWSSHQEVQFGQGEIRSVETAFAAAMRAGDAVHGTEVRIKRPDGSQMCANLHVAPVKDAAGQVIGAISCFHPVPQPRMYTAERAAIAEGDGPMRTLAQSERQLNAELSAARQLQSISAELIQEDDVQGIHDKLVDAAATIMKSDYASMQMLYPERGSDGELRLLASRGFNLQAVKFWEWVRAKSESTCGVALRTGRRVVVGDVSRCEFMVGSDDLKTYLQNGIHAVQSTPLVSRTGQMLGMISTHWNHPHEPAESELRLLDVLARQAADLIERAQSKDRLRHSEEQLRLATEAADVGLWDYDPTSERMFLPPRVKAMFGISDDIAVSMERFYEALHPDHRDRTRVALADALNPTKRSVFDVEFRTIGQDDISARWVAVKGRGIFSADQVCIRVIGTAIDVTSRKHQEEHQRLLLNELNHRVKNTLATVQAMARQTFRKVPNAMQARAEFEARLMALSKAHDVLTRECWDGASLRELIEGAVAPYRVDGRERFEIDGPELRVSPKYALALAMALHELCTNAVKYGSLSNDVGQVSIWWTTGGLDGVARLHLRWTEMDGPPVCPPTRRGFGSLLVERGLKQDLDGEARIEFATTGVACTIETAIEAIGDSGSRQPVF
jgi:PAS domain S-box-containing protein